MNELRTHLNGRSSGFVFESNRHTRYSTRTVQAVVTDCARATGIEKRVYPTSAEALDRDDSARFRAGSD